MSSNIALTTKMVQKEGIGLFNNYFYSQIIMRSCAGIYMGTQLYKMMERAAMII